MPVLPGRVGSSLTDEPIADRIVDMPDLGPADAEALFDAFIVTMRSWASASGQTSRPLAIARTGNIKKRILRLQIETVCSPPVATILAAVPTISTRCFN